MEWTKQRPIFSGGESISALWAGIDRANHILELESLSRNPRSFLRRWPEDYSLVVILNCADTDPQI
jgi:hypothetical protein